MAVTLSLRARPSPTDPLERLRRVSRAMTVVTGFVMLLVAATTILVWIMPLLTGFSVFSGTQRLAQVYENPAARVAAVCAGLVLLAVALYALSQARGLFADFADGKILTYRAAERLKRIAYAVIAGAVLRFATQMLLRMMLADTAGEAAKRFPLRWLLSLRVALDDLGFLLAGLLLLAIAWAMAEGARIAADYRQIV